MMVIKEDSGGADSGLTGVYTAGSLLFNLWDTLSLYGEMSWVGIRVRMGSRLCTPGGGLENEQGPVFGSIVYPLLVAQPWGE